MNNPDFLKPGKLPGELLDRLIRTYKTAADPSVTIDSSYGFDAAAIEIGGETLLVKSDPITFASADAARYLVAVNANDIACLGGTPRWMTVVSLLPEGSTTVELVESQFADLQKACMQEGISLIGGHTEITIGLDRPLLIGTLLGTVGPNGLLEPGKANAGDELWMTHTAGIEGTALLAFEKEAELREALGADIVGQAQALMLEPGISVSRDAQLLLRTKMVTAMHDATEGGVATAIHETASASGLGASIDVESIPILTCTREISNHFGIDPLGLLSSGSLIVAARPGSESLISQAMVPMTKIGILTEKESGITISSTNGAEPLKRFDSDELTRAFVD